MKIAQVCPRYCPHIGGVETHVKEISERLVKRGYEIEVLTTDPEGRLPKEEVVRGTRVKRFKSWAPNEAYYFSRALKRYLAENSKGYDVVHTHSYHAFPALYAAQAKRGNRLIFTPHYHGAGHTFLRSLLHIPYRYVGKKIFERADRVVCVSNYEKSLVMKKFKVSRDKIAIIPNGINPREFEGLEKNKDGNEQVILFVGRLEKYKGVDCLIKALPKLNPDIRLEIIGKGPYKKALLKLADRLKVWNGVEFYQDLPRGELLQKYSRADLFVLLSKYEAFGISVAEALASGTPCILARTSALKEWVDGRNCFGIDYPIDVGKLAYLINKVIQRKVCRVSLVDWNEVANRLIATYRNLLFHTDEVG